MTPDIIRQTHTHRERERASEREKRERDGCQIKNVTRPLPGRFSQE